MHAYAQSPPVCGRRYAAVLAAAVVAGLTLLLAAPAFADSAFVTIDRFIAHRSTVPANAGQRVGLFVREKLSRETADALEAGERAEAVLFVHGNSIPSVPDWDLPYEDYSWMEYLAEAGFDAFALDHTGYGHSPRPRMDEPCNLGPDDQALVTPTPLDGPCEPTYPHRLTSFETDWDEIDTAVEFIRELRGVERVHLIGWSMGGPRAGGYAARHPQKVGRLVLFAPGYQADAPAGRPRPYPPSGVPMSLQTREALMQQRWESDVACDGQVDPGIRDVIWRTIMGYDAFGSVWGPADGVMRVRSLIAYGWNAALAADVAAPTLILVGEQDALLPSAEALYEDLTGADGRLLVRMDCATHFALWEASQYRFMHEASRDWLRRGEVRGRRDGVIDVGEGAD